MTTISGDAKEAVESSQVSIDIRLSSPELELIVSTSAEPTAGAQITITLPDGSTREIAHGTTVRDFAYEIGPGLGKATVGAKLDGGDEIVDIRLALANDCSIELVTTKSDDGLHVIRHSASHVMADAICRIWPDAKLSIGPSTADGFYYDIDLEHRITDDDLEKIEAEMAKIVAADDSFERCDIERSDALDRYRAEGEIYKVELIEDFDPQEDITVYRHGAFEDLCRGPHVPSTGYIKAWKILKIAGAYWRGDENRQVLQRIYGTAFADKKELKKYLHRLEEASKRDHRKLGKDLDLFMISPLAAASPIFLPKGTIIYNELQAYVRTLYEKYGYDEVITPQIFDVEMWKKSGHYAKYRDNMYFASPATDVPELSDENAALNMAVKPMNCPAHALVYASKRRSYRDLALRIADFGRLHRFERSGVTGGLTRVRSFAQDDAHIFCRPDQVEEEMSAVMKMIREVYEDFRFGKVSVYLSTRPEMFIGSEELWNRAEADLEQALKKNDLDYSVNPGDGAFYGPKIDFIVHDALEREWQLGTIQLDFNLPERFELTYQTADGNMERPVVVHRAVLGSIERFMGIVIEHFAGAFPAWLAPVQASVLTINDSHRPYAETVVERLEADGFRVEKDFHNAKLGAKIREAQLAKIPYALVCGDQEAADDAVAVRAHGGENLGAMKVDAFRELLRDRIAKKE